MSNEDSKIALGHSLLNYLSPEGVCVRARSLPYTRWIDARRELKLWPYSKLLMSKLRDVADVANEFGACRASRINFGS
jgi:hypothetical protein